MDWMQTFTIIISLWGLGFVGMRAFWRVFSHTTNRYDKELRESRKLWASILQENKEMEKERKEIQRKMYELEQSRKA